MNDLSYIKKLKVTELKTALGARGLAVKGRKDELVKRLTEAMEEDENPPAEEGAEVAEEAVEEPPREEVSQESEDTEDTPQQPEEQTSEQQPDEQEAETNTVGDEQPPKTTISIEVEDPVVQTEGIDDQPNTDDDVTNAASDVTNAASDETDNANKESQDGKAGEDWVMVDAPSKEEMASTEQANEENVQPPVDNKVDDVQQSVATEADTATTEVQSSEKPLQEATVDTPSEVTASDDVEMKPTTEETPATEETPTASTEITPTASTEITPASTTDTKSEEKAVEKTEEIKVEIKDEMVEVDVEEGEELNSCEVPEGQVGLDQYTSDMHFIVGNNGLSGKGLLKNGFAYLWSGARANKGAKGGKVGYEVKITKFETVELPAEETPVNAVRIGWSAETTDLQLGEASLSYGFESTGKVCASSSFFKYGVEFGEGDVIGTYLDLESEPKTLKYTKNGEDLGVAMSLTVNLEEKPLFPHILLRNVCVEINFGDNESTFFETPEGYSLIQGAPEENTVSKTSSHVSEDDLSEVIMMVGLPSSGKSSWVRKYCDSHPEKCFNVIGMSQLLERCKLEGKKRQKNDKNHEEFMKCMMKALTKLYQLCPTRRRNFIYDQNNVYKMGQDTKMELFTSGFKRKAVVIVPTHDNLRRRTSEAKRKGDCIDDIPFGDLCDMKCEFNIPEIGGFFDEVTYPELDERNASKTVRDYHSDGSRAKKTGRDDYYPKKRPRYDDRRRDHRYGDRDRRSDGWRGSGSGYGGGQRRNDSSGYKGSRGGNYQDPYRRHGGGGGGGAYRQHSYGSSGGGYRSGGYGSGGSGGYGQSYGGYGQSYGAYGSQQGYGNYNYNYANYNQAASNRSTGQWAQPQQQYGTYTQNQTAAGWGTGGQWAGYNYNSGTGTYNATGSNQYGNTGGGGYGY